MQPEDLQTFCLELLQSARQWRRLADLVVRPQGVSESTALPLLLIARHADLRHSELADLVGVEAPSLVRTIDQLCASGLVTRDADSTDKRVKRLNLTPKGQALADRLATDLNQLRKAVFDGVDETDLAAARRVLARVSGFEAPGAGEAVESGLLRAVGG